MKSVLISIQPKWVDKIASGEKTIEVRKSRPKLETPFKCYIYETTAKYKTRLFGLNCTCQGKGKVIGEFVCDRIDNKHLDDLIVKEDCERALQGTCLTKQDILAYLSYTRGTDIRQNYKMWCFYGWHISDLKIYDKPKELSEFRKPFFLDNRPMKDWCHNHCEICDEENCKYDLRNKRPPQSWCYVDTGE